MTVLVEVKNLKKYFGTPRGMLHAVDDVSFSIEEGKTMGVVGESGCGKSTLGRTMIHLLDSTGGAIYFEGKDVTIPNRRKLHKLRENMKIIFQDPYSSLNPRMTVEQTIMEPLTISGRYTRKEREEETERLMDLVGIDQRLRLSYPHELDGGRRQRVGIGRALALNPKFIVCDEPVSALDVSIQAQVLNLLQDLQREYGLTYMFVTHDLSVVRHISNDICVMYLGQLVETSPSKELFKKPLHPYTQALISAVPSIDIHRKKERILLEGEITSPINPKPGCRFAARCKYVREKCQEPQQLEEVMPDHFVACCRVREINDLQRRGSMIQIATIETDKAERLMKALCNHFARKITARYEGNKGYIEFGDGKCEITATSNTLIFQAEADKAEGLDHVKRAVGKHLLHFTPEEDIQINWVDPL